MRTAKQERKTKETDISLTLNLDGSGKFEGTSGIGFFDHMLSAMILHSGFSLSLVAKGDLQVDAHHTVEDIGIVLGKAFSQALGEKNGINRFGQACIPMDEAAARCIVDISARPFLLFDAKFSAKKTGNFELCLLEEFFRAFAFNAGITLHISLLYGKNSHHEAEAIFKSVARALKAAVTVSDASVSTKGILG